METISPIDDSALAELISLWQRRRAAGDTLTAAELCRDRPELLPALEHQIAALQQLDALAQDMHETPTVPPQGSDGQAATDTGSLDPYATLPPNSQEPTSPPLSVLIDAPAVPGYEVLGVLGKGGMGIVYKARQVKLDRLVALKMILHSYAGAQERQRFQIEAEAVARLHHPHIVQVFEVGEHNGSPYFSLEYCAGGSLADKLDGTPWGAKPAARMVETLARAMEAAHQAKVIHRDLKPGNVLLTAAGEPKVTDFGLAKKLDVQGQTQTGAVMGTPSYMAPEQASGSKDIGPAADVYALGAILYELLTGRPPFKAATALDTIMQVVNQEPVSVRQLQPQVPRDIETICHKCLQKEPRKRYGSALALAEDLRRFVAGEPVTARPVGRVERGWRWCRRNPMAAGLSGALLTLLIAVAVGSMVAAFHLNRVSNEARHNANLADEVREQEAAARQTAEANEMEARRQEKLAMEQKHEAKHQASIAAAVNDFLQKDLLGQADIGQQVVGPSEERDPDVKVRTLLDRASRSIEGKFKDQPLIGAAIRLTIGDAYLALHRYAESEGNIERSLQLRTARLGADHPDTLLSRSNLADLYYAQEKYDLAEPLYKEIAQGRTAKLRADHPDTLGTMASLSLNLLRQKRYAEAEPILRDSLARRLKKQPDEWRTFNTYSMLGEALTGQKKYADAEPMLLKGYDGMKQHEKSIIEESSTVCLIAGRERLVQLYDTWGKKDKADDYRKKLAEERAKLQAVKK